jgi:hypothetical protein
MTQNDLHLFPFYRTSLRTPAPEQLAKWHEARVEWVTHGQPTPRLLELEVEAKALSADVATNEKG